VTLKFSGGRIAPFHHLLRRTGWSGARQVFQTRPGPRQHRFHFAGPDGRPGQPRRSDRDRSNESHRRHRPRPEKTRKVRPGTVLPPSRQAGKGVDLEGARVAMGDTPQRAAALLPGGDRRGLLRFGLEGAVLRGCDSGVQADLPPGLQRRPQADAEPRERQSGEGGFLEGQVPPGARLAQGDAESGAKAVAHTGASAGRGHGKCVQDIGADVPARPQSRSLQVSVFKFWGVKILSGMFVAGSSCQLTSDRRSCSCLGTVPTVVKRSTWHLRYCTKWNTFTPTC
jgi:hypothetical protein